MASQNASPCQDPMLVLPAEVVIQIVCYVPLRSMLNLRVNKSWRVFINDTPELWRNLDLRNARTALLRRVARNSDYKLNSIKADRKALNILSPGCSIEGVTINQHSSLLRGLNLKHLHITNFLPGRGPALRQLISEMPLLETLTFVDFIDTSHLPLLVTPCNNLKVLTIESYRSNFTSFAHPYSMAIYLPNLECLELRLGGLNYFHSPQFWREDFRDFSKLRSLSIFWRTGHLQDLVIPPSLRHLRINRTCTKFIMTLNIEQFEELDLTLDDIKPLKAALVSANAASKAPRLRLLKLRGLSFHTKADGQHLLDICRSRMLTCLTDLGLIGLSGSEFARLDITGLQQLQVIDLSETTLDCSLARSALQAPMLSKLYLSRVTSAGINLLKAAVGRGVLVLEVVPTPVTLSRMAMDDTISKDYERGWTCDVSERIMKSQPMWIISEPEADSCHTQ